MKAQTSQNSRQVLDALPDLIQKATLAQTQLESIVTHLQITQDGVLRSRLPPTNGVSRFTSQFEEYSGLILSAVTEISSVLTQVTESIGQVEFATRELVTGVESQLNVNPVASMREAVDSLDTALRTRPTTSMAAVAISIKH